MSGNIPLLAGLPHLQIFYVESNRLDGEIPPLAGLTLLADFRAGANQLSGNIPPLAGLANLAIFDVGSNRLTGGIPLLDGLSLLYLNVGANQLSGSVPAAPATAVPSGSVLCPNLLDLTPSAEWNIATGYAPWWATPYSTNECDDFFTSGFDF